MIPPIHNIDSPKDRKPSLPEPKRKKAPVHEEEVLRRKPAENKIVDEYA